VPTLRIPKVWDYQRELIYAKTRFCYIAGGRRSGKSLASMFRQCLFAWESPNTNHWTIDQTHGEVSKWFRYALMLLPRDGVRKTDKTEKRIELANGSVWNFRSAEDPTKMRGSGLHSVVGHEVAYWPKESWTSLRPALSDYLGWAVLNSTPRGAKNWFTEEWNYANGWQDDGTWASSRRAFHWPTAINPTILPVEVEDARRTLPDATFRQEYLGEFVSDSGSLFHFPASAWAGRFELPQPNGRYVAGYDLAKKRDYTAWIILRVDTLPWRVVDCGRMQQIDYSSQLGVLASKFKQYKILVGLSDQYQEMVTEQLLERGVDVQTYPLSATSRATLLMNLAVAGEQNQLLIPGKDTQRQQEIDVLRSEVENFTPNVSRMGTVRYEAAHGHHDDYVFALAMAVEAGKRHAPLGSRESFAYLSVGGRGRRF